MPATLTATPVVQVGAGQGPLTANPTWTDYSSRVRAWTTHRARDEQAGTFQTGQAVIVLANNDRALEPYVGTVRRRNPVQISMSDGTPIFRGVIDRVDLSYGSDGKDGVATLTCIDLLGYLATVQLAAPYTEAVLASQPLVYLPFTETAGTVAADASGNGANGTYDAVSVTLGQPSLVADDAGHSVTILDPTPTPAVGHGGQIRGNLPGGVQPAILTLEALFQCSALTDTFYFFAAFGATQAVAFGVTTGGNLAAEVYGVASTPTAVSSVTVLDGNPHHIVFTASDLTNTATWNFRIDGVLDAGTVRGSSAGATFTPTPGFLIGFSGTNTTGSANTVTVDNWAYYGRVLSAAEVSAHYAAVAGLVGQRSGARVSTVLGYAGVPTSLVDVDTGGSVLANAGDLSANKALTVLRTVEVTEAGGLFARRDGVIALRDRNAAQGARTASAAVQHTYVSTDYSGITLADPADQLVNSTKVTSRGAAAATVTDVNSVAAVGDLSSSLTTNAPSEPLFRAQYEVASRSAPSTLWVTSLTFLHRAEPLAHELWDRISVTFAPPGGGSPLTQTALVTGVSHTWDVLGKRLVTILSLNPLEAQAFAVWGTGLWGRSDTLWDLTAKWGSASTPWGPNTVDLLDGTARWFF